MVLTVAVHDICPTMLSDFIRTLQKTLDEDGDMPVTAAGECHRTSAVHVSVEPFYYDGGWLDPAEKTSHHLTKWVRSRTHRTHLRGLKIRADEPEWYISEAWCMANNKMDLYDPPERRDTIDGEPVGDVPDSDA